MHLADVRVGLPILRLQVRLHHSTPRTPTAFERVLLKLCERLGSNPAYNKIALDRLFSDFLGVPDPTPLLEPILQELVRISVLRANSAELLTDRLSLQDLEVTERGRQLLIEDQLPSHPQCNDEVYYYDPIADRLLSPLEAKFAREEPPAASIDAEAFRELLPEALIRADVARVAPPWWSNASRIDRIERASVTSVLWRETTAGIECIDGEIRIQTKDRAQAQYISGLPSGEIFRRILTTALIDPSAAAEKWGALPAFDLASVAKSDVSWMPIRQAAQAFPAQASVCLVDQSAQIMSMPDHASPGQVIISFDESLASGEVTLTWNEAGDGCLVRVGNRFPLPNVAMASLSQVVSVYRASFRVGRDPFDLPLARLIATPEPSPNVLSALDELAISLVRAGVDDGLVLASLWMPTARFWSEYVTHSLADYGDLASALNRMKYLRQKVAKLTGRDKDEDWEAAVARLVGDDLGKRDRLDAAQLSALMEVIESCAISAPAVVDHLVEVVLSRSMVPKNLSEYAAIATSVHRGGPAWRIRFPSPLHSAELLRDAITAFGDSDVAETLGNDNRFDAVVQQLHSTYRALDRALGSGGLQALSTKDDQLAALKSKDGEAILGLSARFAEAYRDLCHLAQSFEVTVANSPLEVVASKVESLRALLLELGVALTKRFRSVYVVDTSALVAEPDLLTKFGDDELVVVSKRVIEELDDKKRDETLRPAVARATRLLREFPRVRIEFCDGDLSLLSPDYRNKGDNHILSVAVKFKGQQPTLLTNDNLLALKATAEGIQTMDSRRFSQRTPPAATSRMTSRPAPRDRAMTIDGNNVKPSRRKS